MPYSYEDIEQSIKTGKFMSLGAEAARLYTEAEFLYNYDADLPAMLASLAAHGAIEPLNRAQISALISLFLAVVARMENPSANPVGSPLDQTNLPGSSVTDVPEAFRSALAGLDLETL